MIHRSAKMHASAHGVSRRRRGAALLWSLAGLSLLAGLAPFYVTLCQSLVRLTARGGYRLIAVNRGTAELERLYAGPTTAAEFLVPELPEGRGNLHLSPDAPGLLRADLHITWVEPGGITGRAQWTTLLASPGASPEAAHD
jgi:hypothetical protein